MQVLKLKKTAGYPTSNMNEMKIMDEYNCGDCARFYSVDEWNGECSKHGCVNCMLKICKDFILNDMRKEDEKNG